MSQEIQPGRFPVDGVDGAFERTARQRVDPDLETIVLKALEKELARLRTKLASGQGQDIAAQAVEAKGAKVQRPLWASTGTKNPAYSDVKYVDELIGPDTVNTMPLATIEAFEDHGVVRRTIDEDLDTARRAEWDAGNGGRSAL